ncbi:MAG: fatty acid desaturase, partial [Deltaproteobacteria bacterium]|nr:fatty acid desaturase [Deltaproteobacteria bacterium]
IHHGFTNVIDADQALDTGPVVWHQKMLARSNPKFIALQAWVWFLVILPLTLPLFIAQSITARGKRGDWFRIMFIVLRWVVAFILFKGHLVLLFAPVMAAGYLLSLTSSLNHFHKPIDEEWDRSFGSWVSHVTQNLRERNSLAQWLTGGLNFHIEHHLFPTMPRHNYPVICAEVQLLMRQHGLPYSTCTVPQALKRLWQKLRNPYDGAYQTPVRMR